MKKPILILFVTVIMFSLSGCSISQLVGKTTSEPITLTIPKTTITEITKDGETTTTHIQYKAYKVVKGSNCYEVKVKTYGDEENSSLDWTYYFLSDGTLMERNCDYTNQYNYPERGTCHDFYFCVGDLKLFLNEIDHVEDNKYYPYEDNDTYYELQTDNDRFTALTYYYSDGSTTSIEYNENGYVKYTEYIDDDWSWNESTTFQEVPIDEN